MEWIKAHWWIVPTFVIPVLATIANRLRDGAPKTWVGILIDVLSLSARPGMRGVMGSVSFPGVPSRKPSEVKEPEGPQEGGSISSTAMLALAAAALCLAALLCAGCTPTWQGRWKAAGIDATKCAIPGLFDAAADAAIELLNRANGSDVDFRQLGVDLAKKYGPQAALCAAGKVWADLGGQTEGVGVSSHALMADGASYSRAYAAAGWLVAHQGEW